MKKVKSWRMATWNLQGGLLDPMKTIMVGNDLTKNGIDFVALQEVQSREEKIQGLGRNYIEILLPKGKGSGLEFAVARKHKEKIMSFRIFSERVASVTIRAEEKKGTKMLTIINVHSPTLALTRKSPEVSMAFYEVVREAKEFHAGKFEDVIIAGDWNAKLGRGTTRTQGRFTLGSKRNENGDLLSQFILTNRLVAINTLYRKNNQSDEMETRGEGYHEPI